MEKINQINLNNYDQYDIIDYMDNYDYMEYLEELPNELWNIFKSKILNEIYQINNFDMIFYVGSKLKLKPKELELNFRNILQSHLKIKKITSEYIDYIVLNCIQIINDQIKKYGKKLIKNLLKNATIGTNIYIYENIFGLLNILNMDNLYINILSTEIRKYTNFHYVDEYYQCKNVPNIKILCYFANKFANKFGKEPIIKSLGDKNKIILLTNLIGFKDIDKNLDQDNQDNQHNQVDWTHIYKLIKSKELLCLSDDIIIDEFKKNYDLAIKFLSRIAREGDLIYFEFIISKYNFKELVKNWINDLTSLLLFLLESACMTANIDMIKLVNIFIRENFKIKNYDKFYSNFLKTLSWKKKYFDEKIIYEIIKLCGSNKYHSKYLNKYKLVFQYN